MDLQPLLERRERRVPEWGVNKVLILLIVSVIVLTVEIWLSEKPFPVKKALVCYGPLLHMIFIAFMWAINVLLFSKAGVDLPELFGRGTSTDYPTAQAILQRIAWIVALGAINVTIFFGLYSWIEEDKWASLLPVLSYIAGVILLVFTFLAKEGDYCYVPFLKYVGEEMYQNIVVWSEELPLFRTMFLADILTSTIKVWVDVGSFICQYVCAMMPLGFVCDAGVYATISDCTRFMILLLPSLIRMIQCVRLLKAATNDIGTHAGNVIKYVIAVAAVVLSALRFYYSESWTIFNVWIIVSALNSIYCCFWDVLADWDLRHFAEAFHVDPHNFWHRLLFRWKLSYIWAVGSNAILRCTLLWSYELLKKSDKFVFMITMLEIFRRFQFTVFRVVKLWTQLDHGVQIPLPAEVPPELPPADHGVQIPPPAEVPPELPPADHGVQIPPPAEVPPPQLGHGVQIPLPAEVPPELSPAEHDHGVQIPLPAEVPPELPPADIPPPRPADDSAANQGGGENGGSSSITIE